MRLSVKTALAAIIILSSLSSGYPRIYQSVDEDGDIKIFSAERKRYPSCKGSRVLSDKYDYLINPIAREKAVDPQLVKCIIKVESDFKPNAVSNAGAIGLMQLMLDTAQMYKVNDPFDPAENIRAGVSHFASLMKSVSKDIPLALAAYHAGLGRVKRSRGIPPIEATIAYVNRIMYLYKGENTDSSERIKLLYRRIEKDGTIAIFSE